MRRAFSFLCPLKGREGFCSDQVLHGAGVWGPNAPGGGTVEPCAWQLGLSSWRVRTANSWTCSSHKQKSRGQFQTEATHWSPAAWGDTVLHLLSYQKHQAYQSPWECLLRPVGGFPTFQGGRQHLAGLFPPYPRARAGGCKGSHAPLSLCLAY